jgi:hypothetical protein
MAHRAAGADGPSVLIGMPIYEGWDLVGEALESIAGQTLRNFRALISVDGADERSYAECRKYVKDDPRFELVLQPTRLNWEGNINWLAGELREDFFCYWQHDDYCDRKYLQVLADHAVRHPEASVVYCDMQSFGRTQKLIEYPSLTGFALERVLTQIVKNNAAFIRCLIRADALRASLPIEQAGIWGVALARAGELHRVPKAMYHRRVYDGSLSVRMRSGPPESLRAPTLEWGLGVLAIALPLVPEREQPRLLAFIADQLVHHGPRGRFHYDFNAAGPGARLQFVADFLREAGSRFGVIAFPEMLAAGDPRLALTERKARYENSAIEALMMDALLANLPERKDEECQLGARGAQ